MSVMGYGGGLTGSSTGSSSSQSQSSPGIVPGMMGVYSQLLGMNQQNYGNVLNAYNQGQGKLGSSLPGVYNSYGQTLNNVDNTLGMGQVLGQNGNWGVAAPAAQAIGQTYAQNTGNTTQQMTNAGLGNTTAVGNAQTQNALSASQAYGGLGAQLAQTAAGYQAQMGLAQSGAEMQGLGMQTGLTQGALGALGQQYSNTAGNLVGQTSTSNSHSSQSSAQQNPQSPQQQAAQQAAQAGQQAATQGNGGFVPSGGIGMTIGGGSPSSGTRGGSSGGSSVQIGSGEPSPGFSVGGAGAPTTGLSGNVGVTGQNPGSYSQYLLGQYGPGGYNSPAGGSQSPNGANVQNPGAGFGSPTQAGPTPDQLAAQYGATPEAWSNQQGLEAAGLAQPLNPSAQADPSSWQPGSPVPEGYVPITNPQGKVVLAKYSA